jgi:hypothetical protein
MIYIGSCSRYPSCEHICVCSMMFCEISCPFFEKMENLVEVVDWSKDARYYISLIIYLFKNYKI